MSIVIAEYVCGNPDCKGATVRDHGAEGAVFAPQKCPKCGNPVSPSFHHVEVSEDGQSARRVNRFDHGVR